MVNFLFHSINDTRTAIYNSWAGKNVIEKKVGQAKEIIVKS